MRKRQFRESCAEGLEQRGRELRCLHIRMVALRENVHFGFQHGNLTASRFLDDLVCEIIHRKGRQTETEPSKCGIRRLVLR